MAALSVAAARAETVFDAAAVLADTDAPMAASPTEGAAPAEAPRFSLQQVVFDGATTLTQADLEAAWAPYRGKPVTLANLREIARRAEKIYADKGHPFVAITVPPQDVPDGVVHFQITEGQITSLTILGSDSVARRQAAAVFGSLMEDGTPSSDKVTSVFAAAKDVPGLTTSGTLRRGDTPGGMDLVVQARRRPWNVYFNANSMMGNSIGPWGGTISADYAGGSLYGDRTTAQLFSTFDVAREQVFRISHTRKLNAEGLGISASLLLAQAEPSTFLPSNPASEVLIGRFDVSRPLITRGGFNLSGQVGFEWNDQSVDRPLPFLDTHDHLRVLTARLSGRWQGDTARVDSYVELRQGLDFAGASGEGDALLSRAGANPQALVWRGGVTALSPKLGPIVVWARFDGQYSSSELLSAEQYGAGNFTIGRGFAPGAAFGDRAAAGSVEVRLGPITGGQFRFTPFAFYDAAWVWSDGIFGDGKLASVGGGIRAEVPGRLRMEVFYAQPRQLTFFGSLPNSPRLMVNMTVSLNSLLGLNREPSAR
ncbi:MAG: POTRA domain-containing protein [Caulobacteraceae bacterium]